MYRKQLYMRCYWVLYIQPVHILHIPVHNARLYHYCIVRTTTLRHARDSLGQHRHIMRKPQWSQVDIATLGSRVVVVASCYITALHSLCGMQRTCDAQRRTLRGCCTNKNPVVAHMHPKTACNHLEYPRFHLVIQAFTSHDCSSYCHCNDSHRHIDQFQSYNHLDLHILSVIKLSRTCHRLEGVADRRQCSLDKLRRLDIHRVHMHHHSQHKVGCSYSHINFLDFDNFQHITGSHHLHTLPSIARTRRAFYTTN